MGAVRSNKTYQFDRFCLDLAHGTLAGPGGKAIALRPKSFALLQLMVEHAGRILDRDTIMHAIWPGVVIADEGIDQCVRDIRKALGPTCAALVRTEPRRGYRFVGGVQIGRAPGVDALSVDGPPIVFVAPFAGLTTEADETRFAAGLTEDIITDLSRSRTLQVGARQSPSARYELTGTVLQSGDHLRVTARLVDPGAGTYIWCERYDRDGTPRLSVQSELGMLISTAAEGVIIAHQQRRAMMVPTTSLGPRTIYERGLWHASRCTAEDTAAAKDLFQQAIQLNGRFAAPYTALATASFDEGVIYGSIPIEESVRLAGSWARRAVNLDPDDADARATLALAILTAGRIDDAWDQATAPVDRPNLPWAQAVRGTIKLYGGAPAEGRELLLDALGLTPQEPRNAIIWTQIAISHYFEGNYHATVEAAKRAIVRYPDHPIAYRWLAMAHGQLGQAALARRSLTEAMMRLPQTFRRYANGRPVWMQAEDYAHVLDGQRMAGW